MKVVRVMGVAMDVDNPILIASAAAVVVGYWTTRWWIVRNQPDLNEEQLKALVLCTDAEAIVQCGPLTAVPKRRMSGHKFSVLLSAISHFLLRKVDRTGCTITQICVPWTELPSHTTFAVVPSEA